MSTWHHIGAFRNSMDCSSLLETSLRQAMGPQVPVRLRAEGIQPQARPFRPLRPMRANSFRSQARVSGRFAISERSGTVAA